MWLTKAFSTDFPWRQNFEDARETKAQAYSFEENICGGSIASRSGGGKSGQRRTPHHLTDGITPNGVIQKVSQKLYRPAVQRGKGENVR